MLKPPATPPPSEPEASIGDLIERLFDEVIDYGRAEIELVKARARELAEGYVRAAILFGIAGVLALAGVVTLFVGIAISLARWIGPLGGAIVSLLLAGAIAGLLVWFALRDVRKEP
ncbi:MAG TPA: phage holin family protein [Sphingomicrobium sp.]|jgi:4-hydroxybenzoate polyprenyltransferase|nr:phage holin family protein [Sphingomicrobium sp.]